MIERRKHRSRISLSKKFPKKTENANLASRVSDRKAFFNCGGPKNYAFYMSDVKIIVLLLFLKLFLLPSILRFFSMFQHT